jgi:hypothetical protein
MIITSIFILKANGLKPPYLENKNHYIKDAAKLLSDLLYEITIIRL